MKCIIVIPSLRRAGAETTAVDLANGLLRCGHSVHIFTFVNENDQIDRLSDGIQLHHHARNGRFSFSYMASLGRIIDEHEIDVVYSVMQLAALVGWVASKRSHRKPPVVAAIHTTTNQDLVSEAADRLVYRHILNSVSAVIFVCEYQKKYWIRKYSSLVDHAFVVYNGIDAGQFNRDDFLTAGRQLRQRLGIDANDFVFTCIAGFRPEKGHKLLVQAFSELPDSPYLLLAGEGSTRTSIEKRVKELDLDDRVKFLGKLADVRPAVAASDVSILASTAVETFSIAMLESLAMATPMIAPRIGGLAEAIIDGETGKLFPVGDCTAMVRCMESLMQDPDGVRTIGAAAREKICREFTLQEMVRATQSILVHVVTRRSAESQQR